VAAQGVNDPIPYRNALVQRDTESVDSPSFDSERTAVMRYRLQLLGLVVLAVFAVCPAEAAEPAAPDQAFVRDYLVCDELRFTPLADPAK
jgi:hypothetical protein